MSSADYLTTKDLARELNMSEVALAQMRQRAKGPTFIRLGRTIRYRRADIEAWLAANTVGKVMP